MYVGGSGTRSLRKCPCESTATICYNGTLRKVKSERCTIQEQDQDTHMKVFAGLEGKLVFFTGVLADYHFLLSLLQIDLNAMRMNTQDREILHGNVLHAGSMNHEIEIRNRSMGHFIKFGFITLCKGWCY